MSSGRGAGSRCTGSRHRSPCTLVEEAEEEGNTEVAEAGEGVEDGWTLT